MKFLLKIIIMISLGGSALAQQDVSYFVGFYKSNNIEDAKSISARTYEKSKIIKWYEENLWIVAIGPTSLEHANEIEADFAAKTKSKGLTKILAFPNNYLKWDSDVLNASVQIIYEPITETVAVEKVEPSVKFYETYKATEKKCNGVVDCAIKSEVEGALTAGVRDRQELEGELNLNIAQSSGKDVKELMALTAERSDLGRVYIQIFSDGQAIVDSNGASRLFKNSGNGIFSSENNDKLIIHEGIGDASINGTIFSYARLDRYAYYERQSFVDVSSMSFMYETEGAVWYLIKGSKSGSLRAAEVLVNFKSKEDTDNLKLRNKSNKLNYIFDCSKNNFSVIDGRRYDGYNARAKMIEVLSEERGTDLKSATLEGVYKFVCQKQNFDNDPSIVEKFNSFNKRLNLKEYEAREYEAKKKVYECNSIAETIVNIGRRDQYRYPPQRRNITITTNSLDSSFKFSNLDIMTIGMTLRNTSNQFGNTVVSLRDGSAEVYCNNCNGLGEHRIVLNLKTMNLFATRFGNGTSSQINGSCKAVIK